MLANATDDRDTMAMMIAYHNGMLHADQRSATLADCPYSTPCWKWLWKLGFLALRRDMVIDRSHAIAIQLSEKMFVRRTRMMTDLLEFF